MTSINDVAKKAGVAKSTVSKVLNHYQLVSEETRLKVEKAVKELNYVPNSVAVSLSKKEFNRVGLIMDIRHNSQFLDEIDMHYFIGAFEKAKDYRIDVITFFSSQFDDMTSKQVSATLKSHSINCLIIYNLSTENKNIIDIIEKQDFNCVLVDSNYVNPKTSSVSINHYMAQYEVAKKTIEQTHKADKVLYIAGGQGGYITTQRLNAIKRLKQELEFELTIRYGDFNESKARAITLEYINDVDIIICASDLMAIGAQFVLIENGITKPVCGFDGITLVGYVSSTMNTVKQNFKKKSMIAFDELKRLLDGDKGRYVEIPYDVCTINYFDIINR